MGSATTKDSESLDGEEDREDVCSLDGEEDHGIVMVGGADGVHSDGGTEPDDTDIETGGDPGGTGGKPVANLCAICLEEYHEGDTIVWSSNKNCRHAFHRDCLTSYLVKINAKDTYESYPCPCCRQNFFYEDCGDGGKQNASASTGSEEEV